MEIKVLFFGIIADVTSTNEEKLTGVTDTASLEKKLLGKYPDIEKYKYQITVNHEIIKENTMLKNKDEIALLPPFAGG